MLKRIRWCSAFLLCALLALLVPTGARPAARWGRIANHQHRGQPILSALYFAGPPNPSSVPLYTRHPVPPEPTNWFDDATVDAALQPMRALGLNTIKLSYWGHEGETDAWSPAWLFSRTRWPHNPRRSQKGSLSTHDRAGARYSEAEQVAMASRFFRRAAKKRLLVAPMLEVSAAFPFYADFPDRLDGLVQRAGWLLKHFGSQPNWLRAYDQNGRPRHVIWLIETIHAGPIEPERFAMGFEAAARRLQQQTGHAVGFILDPTPLPAYGSHAGPTPSAMRRCPSVLAINPYNITSQGIGHGSSTRQKKQSELTEQERLAYAESVLSRWIASGIPLLVPIIPGYDAHLVFPANGVYGFNPAWRERQRQLAARYGTGGLSIDTWNGWTEGHAIPPSREDGNVHLRWVRDVLRSLPRDRY